MKKWVVLFLMLCVAETFVFAQVDTTDDPLIFTPVDVDAEFPGGLEELIMFTQRSRQAPTKPAPVVDEHIDQNNSCYLGVSYLSRTVYIFCCSTEKQSDVVIAYLIRKMSSARKQ